jgi:hypothetical protein
MPSWTFGLDITGGRQAFLSNSNCRILRYLHHFGAARFHTH